MKKEDRELLVKDLCARLPYNTVISVTNDDRNTIQYLTEEDIKDLRSTISYSGNIYKPYLFPLSSMTREQEIKCCAIKDMGSLYYHRLIDRYNEWHIDYRGFISKGLALDATGLNIY